MPRPHLIEKLNAGLNRRLTLISASPGFGKTTLVSDWLSQTKRSFGWVSLDEDDNDITRFFTYVITAIQQIKKIGHTTRRLLQSSQPVLPKSLATAFVNDCISTTSPFILVLDDYHNIIEPSINEVVAYILDNMPPNLHLVFTSRVDPLLPISRLRARGHMQELRTDDLRFTKDEAAEFLKIVMGLNLTVEQSSALDTRTEGWIAGLQMAGLSIQGLKSEDKIANFVADFTGSHRYIFDYLTDEVLQQQPESIKDFLVQTSILDQFNSDLCEAVTGQKNSKSILATLESANMFLFPLDENREWYRYHHLFADLLHQRLLSRFPEMIPDLYQRASQWYADHEDVEQAVLYALAGGHATEAAQLLDQSAFQIIGESRLRKLHGLLGKIPEDVRGQYPRLDIAQGWLHMFFGEYDTAEKCLYHAEEKLSSYAYSPIDFPRDFARAYIAMVRSYSATRQGFLSDAVDFSEEALTLLEEIPEESARVLRGTILINLGQTQVGLDDLENARATYDQAILDSQASERVSAVMAAYTCLMQLERNRGRLGIARSAGHQGLAWLNNFKGNDSQLYPSESELRIQLFLICYEQNRLVQAKEHLHISLDLYKATSNQGYVECLHYLFLVALAEGELENAVNIHQEAIPILKDFPFFIYQRYLADCLDRIIRLHRMQPAEKQWIQELHLWLPSFEAQISEVPNSRQEPQLLIKAKALADVGNLEESLSLLEYMTNAAESASRCGDLIQYRVQQSLVLERLSQRELAIDCLEKAASLAASENFMRTFLDEEKGLSQLIYLLPKSPYRDEIISNFLQTDRSTLTSSSIASGDYSMVEPLSERELEVLSLLATHLSGPEIADRLDISINTYKTHAKNIYGKLGVSSRNKAVVNARALGLL